LRGISFCFWIPLSHPSTLAVVFGFTIQKARLLLLLLIQVAGNFGAWARRLWDERRRKIALPRGGHVLLFCRGYYLYIFFLKRSDVWDYSEAFTKRYLFLVFLVVALICFRCCSCWWFSREHFVACETDLLGNFLRFLSLFFRSF
jgi:hypothetical protein